MDVVNREVLELRKCVELLVAEVEQLHIKIDKVVKEVEYQEETRRFRSRDWIAVAAQGGRTWIY